MMADVRSRTGERYATAEIYTYLDGLYIEHTEFMKEALASHQNTSLPAIHLGPQEAKTLSLFIQMIQARKVVEVGTLAGYSALWMARALSEDGRIWTIDCDPESILVSQKIIKAAKLQHKIHVLQGQALDVLNSLTDHGPFDLVFIDADKPSYVNYTRWAYENLRPGGLLVADNSYFFGELLDETADARAVRAFHEECARLFDATCVPTPDGLVIGVKPAA